MINTLMLKSLITTFFFIYIYHYILLLLSLSLNACPHMVQSALTYNSIFNSCSTKDHTLHPARRLKKTTCLDLSGARSDLICWVWWQLFWLFYFCYWMNTVSSGEKQSSFLLHAVTAVISGVFWDKTRGEGGTLTVSQLRGKLKSVTIWWLPPKTCIFPAMQMKGFVFSFSLFFKSWAFALSACIWSAQCCLCIVLREEAMMACWRHRMLCHSGLFDITSCGVSLAAGLSAPGADGCGPGGRVVVGIGRKDGSDGRGNRQTDQWPDS